MVRQVNLYEAKTHLSQLVEDAARGEEIVIAKNGRPIAKLVAQSLKSVTPAKRALGQWRDLVDPDFHTDRPAFWRRWHEADEEILRDFDQAFAEGGRDSETSWPGISSTRMRSSGPKTIRKRSVPKRSKR